MNCSKTLLFHCLPVSLFLSFHDDLSPFEPLYIHHMGQLQPWSPRPSFTLHSNLTRCKLSLTYAWIMSELQCQEEKNPSGRKKKSNSTLYFQNIKFIPAVVLGCVHWICCTMPLCITFHHKKVIIFCRKHTRFHGITILNCNKFEAVFDGFIYNYSFWFQIVANLWTPSWILSYIFSWFG